jgi:hypothetical protein
MPEHLQMSSAVAEMTKPSKPHYRAIYDDVIATDARYNQAENSPGFQVVVGNSESL